jgi:hypothetical protein
LEYDAQPGVADGRTEMQTRRMVFEQRYSWGRAYRGATIVCARVHVTIGRDGRLGLAQHERRYVVARFLERLHPTLRGELTELTELSRSRGAAARRAAERMEPIEVVFDDKRLGRQRITGWVEPPQIRCGELREIEFGLREPRP